MAKKVHHFNTDTYHLHVGEFCRVRLLRSILSALIILMLQINYFRHIPFRTMDQYAAALSKWKAVREVDSTRGLRKVTRLQPHRMGSVARRISWMISNSDQKEPRAFEIMVSSSSNVTSRRDPEDLTSNLTATSSPACLAGIPSLDPEHAIIIGLGRYKASHFLLFERMSRIVHRIADFDFHSRA